MDFTSSSSFSSSSSPSSASSSSSASTPDLHETENHRDNFEFETSLAELSDEVGYLLSVLIMADQPSHKNTAAYTAAEKDARLTIQLARRILKNQNTQNPQLLALETPEEAAISLAELACTLLEIIEDQGVTSDMVARLMGKRAGGREKAIHRLLPTVKKEIKNELKESKGAAGIAKLDEKARQIAMGKRHPKAKGKGKGPKSGRNTDASVEDAAAAAAVDEQEEHAEEHGVESEGEEEE